MKQMRWLVVLALATGCTKTVYVNSAPPPSPGKSAPNASPTDGSVVTDSKPPLKDTRVEGTFRVTYTRLTANVSGSQKKTQRTWVLTPKCQGGGCDVLVESYSKHIPGPHWSSKALLLKDGYQFSRNEPKAYTCGSGGNVDYWIPAVYSYSFEVTKSKLVDGMWVAIQVQGEIGSRGTRGCGLSGPPEEKHAIRGRLMKSNTNSESENSPTPAPADTPTPSTPPSP